MKWLLPFVLLAGCSYPTIPDQREVVDLIWHGVYGNNPDIRPPTIEWIEQYRLNCGPDDNGVNRGFLLQPIPLIPMRQCVAGVYWHYTHTSQVAHPTGFKFSTSSLAHELWHANMYLKTGDADSQHQTSGYKPGGQVTVANSVLDGLGF